jgi:hypothetical protein
MPDRANAIKWLPRATCQVLAKLGSPNPLRHSDGRHRWNPHSRTGRLGTADYLNIGIGIDAGLHTYGIRFDKAPDRRVIVSEVVVVESGLGVVVLA